MPPDDTKTLQHIEIMMFFCTVQIVRPPILPWAVLEAPRRKQRGIFDPKGEKARRIRASNPRPKGRGMRRAMRVQNSRN